MIRQWWLPCRHRWRCAYLVDVGGDALTYLVDVGGDALVPAAGDDEHLAADDRRQLALVVAEQVSQQRAVVEVPDPHPTVLTCDKII